MTKEKVALIIAKTKVRAFPPFLLNYFLFSFLSGLMQFLPYILYCKDVVKPYYIRNVHRVKEKHLFADVLQSSSS